MIRPTHIDDTPRLLALTAATGMFRPLEVDTLAEVLDDYHTVNHQGDHACITVEVAHEIIGFAYWAPAAMTDRGWYLYWIVVDPARQGQGWGTKMLRFAEQAMQQNGGRMLFVETSGMDIYEPTRRFYRKHDYNEQGRVADYYADGDDQVIFARRLDG